MNLSNVEIIKYVIDYLGDNPNGLILFLKNDCNVDIQIQLTKNPNAIFVGVLYYDIIYNGRNIGQYMFINNSREILIELFDTFTEEDKIKIKEKIIEIVERNKKSNTNINQKSNDKSINIYNNSVNNNSLNNSNSNTIDIKTLSDLRSYIENNSNIDNKQEITNLIKELEEAKDNNNEKDYIDKFLKLLELLGNILPIPPVIIKSAKTAKEFFDKVFK